VSNSFDPLKFYRECMDFITTRISTVTVKMLSGRLNMHPNLFCYYFKKVAGKPFKVFILEKKLELARFMLVNTDKSISEVGKTLGYSDVSNFTHFFKRLTGISPKEFRKRQHDKNL